MAREDDIVYYSWRTRSYLGDSILSKVRNQLLVGVGSCPQHSAGAVLEMQTWMKLQREGRGHERKQMDIKDMHDRYCMYRRSMGLKVESSTKQLLLWLQANVSRAENDGSEVFRLEGFEELRPLDKIGDLAKMLNFLFTKGPFIGVFFVRVDFDTGGGKEIYLCEGALIDYSGGLRRHAVAVVGFGIDRNLNPFWEYLESCSPAQSTFKKDGFGRVIIKGFDKAYLLHV